MTFNDAHEQFNCQATPRWQLPGESVCSKSVYEGQFDRRCQQSKIEFEWRIPEQHYASGSLRPPELGQLPKYSGLVSQLKSSPHLIDVAVRVEVVRSANVI